MPSPSHRSRVRGLRRSSEASCDVMALIILLGALPLEYPATGHPTPSV
jgi:hypothetical protein